jgi:hypothetical protein
MLIALYLESYTLNTHINITFELRQAATAGSSAKSRSHITSVIYLAYGPLLNRLLGSFDSFFLYKALSNRFKADEVTCLIDNHNKFIQITLEIEKLKITFKDYYRIYPVSLSELCNIL